MKRLIRSRVFQIVIASAGMTLVAPAVLSAAPSLSVHVLSDGSRWIVGCVDDDTAARLLAHDAFQGSGGPVPILCIVGYTAVHKQIG